MFLWLEFAPDDFEDQALVVIKAKREMRAALEGAGVASPPVEALKRRRATGPQAEESAR